MLLHVRFTSRMEQILLKRCSVSIVNSPIYHKTCFDVTNYFIVIYSLNFWGQPINYCNNDFASKYWQYSRVCHKVRSRFELNDNCLVFCCFLFIYSLYITKPQTFPRPPSNGMAAVLKTLPTQSTRCMVFPTMVLYCPWLPDFIAMV